MSLIIRALPGSGKTFLVSKEPTKFVDIDVLVKRVTGLEPGPRTTELLFASPELMNDLKTQIDKAMDKGRHVLTNVNLSKITGRQADIHFTYGADCVKHVKQTDRLDLLEMFDEKTLASWAKDPSERPGKLVRMKAGQFLSDIVFDHVLGKTHERHGNNNSI